MYHTRAAMAAKEIRTILKKAYPSIKFKVTSENFSMGNAVNVSWDNGVPSAEAEKLISHYEHGHFNSMEDIYEYSNSRDDIPQCKYLMVSRNITEDNLEKVRQEIMQDYGMTEWNDTICREKFNMWGMEKINHESRNRTF